MDSVNIVNIVNTLINSFHDIWHLPALRLVNKAWRERTPSALLEAIQYTEQAITALEHWSAAVEHLVQRIPSPWIRRGALQMMWRNSPWLWNTSPLNSESLPSRSRKNALYVKVNNYSLKVLDNS